MALTALFHDKGCRTNRCHARIRFLRDDFGDEGLVRLFHEYYAKVPADALRADVPAGDPPPETAFPLTAAAGDGFPTWRQLAVSPLAHGLVAVRIFVPFGNFTADELEAFAAAMEPFNATRFEVLPSLDLGVVVPEAQLPGLYATLLGLGRDYVARSFVGNLRTCIGCAVCKSGATDAPEVGRLAGEYFDARYRPLDTAEKLAVARALLDDVRISGCPNSCTCHPLAKFGFAGRKLNGADAETAFTPGSLQPASLGVADVSVPITPATEFPALLERRILAALHEEEATNV